MSIGNLFYFRNLNSVGGTETFFYYLSKKYSKYDIVVVYQQADINQLRRISKYARCVKFYGQTFKCKKAFLNYNMEIIDNVEAEEYYALIHGDYNDYKITPIQHDKIKHYIGVSDIAVKSFKSILPDKDITKIYNPVAVDEPQKTLFLVSATRLTKEKGKDLIIQMADRLTQSGRPYVWMIFTNDRKEISNPNVVYLPPKLNVIDYINKCDYLVQLSRAEGYGYSPVEALSIGKPVIVSDIPAMHEIGVKDGYNGFILKRDLSNLDIDKLYNTEWDFTYTPPLDEWDKILAKGKRKEETYMYKIKANKRYLDVQLGRYVDKDEEYIVEDARAEEIVSKGFAKIVEEVKYKSKLVKQPAKTKKKEK